MDKIDEALINVFRAVFGELDGLDDASVRMLERSSFVSWDSGAHLVLLTCLEEEFKLKLDDETALGIDSFAVARALLVR